MAIYRFRVSFEDYEDVYRDIDMPSKSTFLDLHAEIQKSVGYTVEVSSSFYVSNDQWKKGTEIAFLPSARKTQDGVLLMEEVRLSKFIDDPHQKFYYIYNFDNPYEFHVELIKILKEVDGTIYPQIFKSVGIAPKSAAASNFPISSDLDDDDDFVEDDNLEQYGVDSDDDYAIDEGDEEDSEEDANEEFSMGEDDNY